MIIKVLRQDFLKTFFLNKCTAGPTERLLQIYTNDFSPTATYVTISNLRHDFIIPDMLCGNANILYLEHAISMMYHEK